MGPSCPLRDVWSVPDAWCYAPRAVMTPACSTPRNGTTPGLATWKRGMAGRCRWQSGEAQTMYSPTSSAISSISSSGTFCGPFGSSGVNQPSAA